MNKLDWPDDISGVDRNRWKTLVTVNSIFASAGNFIAYVMCVLPVVFIGLVKFAAYHDFSEEVTSLVIPLASIVLTSLCVVSFVVVVYIIIVSMVKYEQK